LSLKQTGSPLVRVDNRTVVIKFFERIEGSLDDATLFPDSVIWNFKLQNCREQFRFPHPRDSIFNPLVAFRRCQTVMNVSGMQFKSHPPSMPINQYRQKSSEICESFQDNQLYNLISGFRTRVIPRNGKPSGEENREFRQLRFALTGLRTSIGQVSPSYVALGTCSIGCVVCVNMQKRYFAVSDRFRYIMRDDLEIISNKETQFHLESCVEKIIRGKSQPNSNAKSSSLKVVGPNLWISWVLHDSKAAKSEELLGGSCACGYCCGSRVRWLGVRLLCLRVPWLLLGLGVRLLERL
jgi:hypothetical protein